MNDCTCCTSNLLRLLCINFHVKKVICFSKSICQKKVISVLFCFVCLFVFVCVFVCGVKLRGEKSDI